MGDNLVQGASQSVPDSEELTVPAAEISDADHGICDKQFMDDVAQLKALRSYMIRQAKSTQAGSLKLGDLNLLRLDEKGRYPKSEDWKLLENRTDELYRHLSETDRRRFLFSQIPYSVVRTGIILGVFALGAILMAFAGSLTVNALRGPEGHPIGEAIPALYRWSMLVYFLMWVASLAGMGSIAFIGMNALALQEDSTFDITNTKLIVLRVVLGALFGVALALPIGPKPFTDFMSSLYGDEPFVASEIIKKTSLLLLPFLLGFSTSLVMMILNQSLDAIQTFFGKRSNPTATDTNDGTHHRDYPSRRSPSGFGRSSVRH